MNRQSFEIIKRKYDNRGKGNVRLTQSSLLLIQPISSSRTSYNFNVLENEANPLKEEVRLNINDEFICTEVGMFLVARAKQIVGELSEDLPGIILLTYNPIEQTVNAQRGEPFYNGTLKFGANNIVYLEKWDTQKHKFVTRTQFEKRITSGGTTILYPAQIPSNNMSKDAMHSMQPMITLSGAKKNELSLNLPEAGGAYTFQHIVNDNTVIEYSVTEIALLLRGMNAQNAAKFQ